LNVDSERLLFTSDTFKKSSFVVGSGAAKIIDFPVPRGGKIRIGVKIADDVGTRLEKKILPR